MCRSAHRNRLHIRRFRSLSTVSFLRILRSAIEGFQFSSQCGKRRAGILAMVCAYYLHRSRLQRRKSRESSVALQRCVWGRGRLHTRDYAGVKTRTACTHPAEEPRDGGGQRRKPGGGAAYVFCDEVDGYFAGIASKRTLVKHPPEDWLRHERFARLRPGRQLHFFRLPDLTG